jgi:hypothetical protein
VLRAHGLRAVQDDAGPALFVGLSRFSWLHDWKFDRDRVFREMDEDRAAGYRYARVLGQVGSLGEERFWAGREIDHRWPDHEELVAGMTRAAQERGLRLLWTSIGKGGGLSKQPERRSFIERMARTLREVSGGVLVHEMMNEPSVGGEITLGELLELQAIAEREAPGLLSATGAVWVPHGSRFDRAWRRTQREVGIAHLDRDIGREERQDRPWRQALAPGALDLRWIDNEPIGPGSSVETETRAEVLRSHRLVALVCRAFATCFHSRAGVRGLDPMSEMPGYAECPRALRFLPPELPNGILTSAVGGSPERPFDIGPGDVRRSNGNARGLVDVCACRVDRTHYAVAFGLLSEVSLVARRNMVVEILSQDRNDRLATRELQKGERLSLTPAADYLLKCAEA